ncbi:MAG: NAD(P)-binding protein [Lachnospiraceae bacterium]|nr:NAD(P)-binding protein [Lachnospiraceae bacterium]
MKNVKYLILGAGPAGLTFANMLRLRGETSFLVLEKEEQAGGLCRSVDVDGSPFDIGGGHFLDVRRPKVNEFLFQFMPEEEWALFERDSRIEVEGQTIGHPFEANIWQLDLDSQVAILESVAKAGCNNGQPMPEKFKEWITWKLGEKIAGMYMLPYNRKMFSDELDELGTYWLEKLPNVSFEDTLRSCLTHKAYGQQPGHASFYYPKEFGYGELWLRMAKAISDNIVYKAEVSGLDCNTKSVTTKSGDSYSAENIITTIPWNCFDEIKGMEEEVVQSVRKLKSSAIETRYVSENLDTEAQWIYVPEEEIPYHRILVRHNFCQGSRGYWMETRKERVERFAKEAEYAYMNDYAYPLNTIGKPEIMKKLLAACEEKKIYGLGRWGEHNHYNSDLVVELAMKLAEEI